MLKKFSYAFLTLLSGAIIASTEGYQTFLCLSLLITAVVLDLLYAKKSKN